MNCTCYLKGCYTQNSRFFVFSLRIWLDYSCNLDLLIHFGKKLKILYSLKYCSQHYEYAFIAWQKSTININFLKSFVDQGTSQIIYSFVLYLVSIIFGHYPANMFWRSLFYSLLQHRPLPKCAGGDMLAGQWFRSSALQIIFIFSVLYLKIMICECICF